VHISAWGEATMSWEPESCSRRLDGERPVNSYHRLGIEAVIDIHRGRSPSRRREQLSGSHDIVASPHALICTADLLAAGALAEARDAGIAVPKLLSITGMDNIESPLC